GRFRCRPRQQLRRDQGRRERHALEGRHDRRDRVLLAGVPVRDRLGGHGRRLDLADAAEGGHLHAHHQRPARLPEGRRHSLQHAVRQFRRSLLVLERGHHARLPREVLARLPLLGHEPAGQCRRQRLVQGPDLPVRRALRGDPEVHLLSRREQASISEEPPTGAPFVWGAEGRNGAIGQIEKLVPQPQDAVAFGFLTLNEEPMRSSTKSISEPERYSSDTGSTSTRAPSRSITRSSGSEAGTRSNLYWKPEQPPPSTLTRRSGVPGSPATISAMRRAARSDTVTGWVMLHPSAATRLPSRPFLV